MSGMRPLEADDVGILPSERVIMHGDARHKFRCRKDNVVMFRFACNLLTGPPRSLRDHGRLLYRYPLLRRSHDNMMLQRERRMRSIFADLGLQIVRIPQKGRKVRGKSIGGETILHVVGTRAAPYFTF